MLNGFVKLAGKSSPAQLAHKAGLLCKEVCGATQASCFLTQEDEGLSSWSKLSDGKAEVFSFSFFFLSFFSLFSSWSWLSDGKAEVCHLSQKYSTISAFLNILESTLKKVLLFRSFNSKRSPSKDFLPMSSPTLSTVPNSKFLYIVTVYSKYTRALTFENLCQGPRMANL
jgi:hypothetical protein